MPSLIAEIGNVIETHLTEIGMLKATGLDEHQQAFLAEKQAQMQAQQQADTEQSGSGFPASAALCYKCHTKALVQKDGCMTCLNCGDSKCG